MNPLLYKSLLELDKREFIYDNYFKWSKKDKQRLIDDLEIFLDPIMKMTDYEKWSMMNGLVTAIETAENEEDYEQAEIFCRLYDRFNQKYF
jgi:hypothetical protein